MKKINEKKTILITGASTGIGKITALYFANKGWNVAATMRNPDKDNDLLKKENIKLFKLDVLDEKSIKSAVELVLQAFGQIDVLLNNAGYAAVGIFEAAQKTDIDKQFGTNVFGLMQMIQAVLPHFRQRKTGVIINVASVAGKVTFPLYSLYHGTKFAVEGLSESLHYELRPFGIKVRIIEPGPIKTDFYERSMNVIRGDDLHDYDKYFNKVFKNLQQFGDKGSKPEKVARKIYKAAVSKGKKLRYPIGGNAPALLFLRWLLPNQCLYFLIRKILVR